MLIHLALISIPMAVLNAGRDNASALQTCLFKAVLSERCHA